MSAAKSFKANLDYGFLKPDMEDEKKQLESYVTTENLHGANLDLKILPVELLVEDEKNAYLYHDTKDIALDSSVEENGIRDAIRAYKQPNSDKYLIQSGHRRLESAKNNGIKEVPVVVLPWEEDRNQQIRNLIDCNIHDRHHDAMTLAREIDEWAKTRKNWSESDVYDELKEKFGLSESSLRRYRNLMKLIPELQEKVNNPDTYSMAALAEASKLSEDRQKEYAALIDEFVDIHGEDKITKGILQKLLTVAKNGKTEENQIKPSNTFTVKKFRSKTESFTKYFEEDIKQLSLQDQDEAVGILKELKEKIDSCLMELE